MQELVLNPLGRAIERDAARPGRASAREEFELRLGELAALSFRIAQGVLRNPADAEEVAQDSLLRAFRAFHRLRDPARLRSWLVRISFRLALDRWRSKKRREVRESAWSQPAFSAAPQSAEEIAISSEFQARLERALEELPERLRLVLILSAIQGYTVEEVSRLLEIPTGTVKSRLFFARKQLAEKLR